MTFVSPEAVIAFTSSVGFIGGLGGSLYFALRKRSKPKNSAQLIHTISNVTSKQAPNFSEGARMGLKAFGIATGIVVSLTCISMYTFAKYNDLHSLHELIEFVKPERTDDDKEELNMFWESLNDDEKEE